jgi:hypothetical protein
MKSAQRGRSTFQVDVTNIGQNGFWLLLDGQELYLPFVRFPWFRDASIGQILEVDRPSPDHLYWPNLDIDLATESILHPERYPLVSGVRPNKAVQRTVPRVTSVAKKRNGRATRSRR